MKKINIFSVYLLLFSCAVLFTDISNVFWGMIIIVNILIMIKKKNFDIAVLSSFIIGNELFCIINLIICIICLCAKKGLIFRVKKIKVSKVLCLGLILIMGNSIFGAIIYDTYINVFIYSVYLLFIYVIAKAFEDKFNPVNLINIIKKFVIIEFIITLLVAIKYNNYLPGDIHYGTILNAHWFGNWLVLSLIMILLIPNKFQNISFKQIIMKDYLYILAIIFMIYLADAKVIVGSFCFAAAMYIVSDLIYPSRLKSFLYIITNYILVYCLTSILTIDNIKNVIENKLGKISWYIYNDGWNYKFQYFNGTLHDTLSGFRFLIGYGIGQYGSRVANMLAYNIMWRSDNMINNLVASVFSSHYIPEYAKYISMYNYEFHESIQWRSAVLSYPFNSFVAIIGETGFIGLIIISCIINNFSKESKCKILIFYFSIICLFDIYIDNILCIAPLIIYIGNTRKYYMS